MLKEIIQYPSLQKKIESAPTLTREALEQKQAAADQNRQKVIKD